MPNPLVSATGGNPPFLFDGMTARIFPLRAQYTALERLGDTYLNRGSPVARFRPMLPYVYLSILNYGRMESVSETAAHYGWVSQNEVFFAVPLIWETKRDGRWAFHAYGVVAPFIFVDQPWSIEVGREVYGWPKEEASFQREVNSWASGSPADPENLLTLETQSFATPFAGERPARLPLLEIVRAGPWDTGAYLWKPPLSVENPMWTPLTMIQEWARWWSNAGLREMTMKGPLWMMQTMAGNRGKGPFPPFYTINLKQVRDLERPEYAAYQAITAAPMRCTAINSVGVLGEARMWRGDPTGGYRIKLHRHPAYPIAETLGLMLSSEDLHMEAGDAPARGHTAGVPGNTRLDAFPARLSSPDSAKHSVLTLAPLGPYWMDCDMEYGVGDTVMFRGLMMPDWVPGSLQGHPVATAAEAILPTGAPRPPSVAGPPRYDVTWDSRGVPSPPFYYPKVTVRVLPLAADRQRITDFVQNWGMPGSAGALAPVVPTVFMAVMTSEEMTAESNNLGWWWQKQVAFFIPVQWTPGPDAPDRSEGSVWLLASPLAFADGQMATNVAREFGSYMVRANIVSPPDSWLDHDGPRSGRRHMWLSTEVLPALNVDAEGMERVLLEILEVESGGAPLAPWPRPPMPAFPDPETSFSVLGLRQIRDAHDPDQPAFLEWFTQNLRARPSGAATWQAGAIAAPLELRIHHFPELDIVETFGLACVDSEHAKSPLPGRGWEGARVSVIRPVDPFWFTVDMTHVDNTSYAVKPHARPWFVERKPLPRTTRLDERERERALALYQHLFRGARE
jgi:hypothetical protein